MTYLIHNIFQKKKTVQSRSQIFKMQLTNFSVLFFIFSPVWTLTDKEYALLPNLFHFDDFDHCMLYGEKALFCRLTLKLFPKNEKNTSEVWNVIQKTLLKQHFFKRDVLRHSICLTKQCPNVSSKVFKNNLLVNSEINRCYGPNFEKLGLTTEVETMQCRSKNASPSIDFYDILFVILILGIITLSFYAWFYDVAYKPDRSNKTFSSTCFGKYISSFSVTQNWKALTTVNLTTPEARALSCLQGVQLFNSILIIINHTIVMNINVPLLNPSYREQSSRTVLIGNQFNSLQPFFFLSTWLLTFTILKDFEGKKEIPLIYLVRRLTSRYLRLAPLIMLSVFSLATWTTHVSDGPEWDVHVGKPYKKCRKFWWTNLFFISSFLSFGEMCGSHMWSLAVDLQLYILTLSLAWVLLKYPSKTIWLLCSLWVYHVISVFWEVSKGLDFVNPSPEKLNDGKMEDILNINKMTASNIPAALSGSIFCYIFFKNRHQKLFVTKKSVTLMWTLILSTMFISLFSPLLANYFSKNHGNMILSIYVCFSRTFYNFSLGLFVLGMTQGHGGILKVICESTPVYILGRLTYAAYLVHPFIFRIKFGLMRTPNYLNSYILVFDCITDVALSFFLAVPVTLFFEMPFESAKKHFIQTKVTDNTESKKIH